VTALKNGLLLPSALLLLLFMGCFTRVGELQLPHADPCGAFTLGRSVLDGCDGLGGPPESSTAMQRLMTVIGNIRYAVEQTLTP
jgi:hypothetical protein